MKLPSERKTEERKTDSYHIIVRNKDVVSERRKKDIRHRILMRDLICVTCEGDGNFELK